MLMDMSDYAEPSPTELEQIVDEARQASGRGPAPRAAAQGIKDMNERIEYQTQLKEKLRSQFQPGIRRDDLETAIRTTDSEIALARARLAEYETQLTGLN